MGYDPLRKLYTPDFMPPDQMQGWQDMGDDQQVNISPAVGAFKQRFMGNRGDTNNVPNPGIGDQPEIDNMMPDGGGGSPVKKGMKSL